MCTCLACLHVVIVATWRSEYHGRVYSFAVIESSTSPALPRSGYTGNVGTCKTPYLVLWGVYHRSS